MITLIVLAATYLIMLSALLWAACWQALARRDRLHFTIRTLVASALAIGLAKLASRLYYDPRPFALGHFTPLISHAADNGFPSDHALLASLLALVILTKNRSLGLVALIVAALIGAARVAAGVHHPLDIIGSFAISIVAVALTLAGERFVRRRSADQP